MSFFLAPLRRTWAALAAFALQCRGRWRLRRGDPERAARDLEAAAARRPGAFTALLHLTRAHLRRRDLVLARRALARAREASPVRFDREVPGALRAEGFDVAALAEVAPVARTMTTGPELGTAVLERSERTRLAAPLGDCRDLDEYTRFQCMPPISAAEVAATDWDALLDDLLEP